MAGSCNESFGHFGSQWMHHPADVVFEQPAMTPAGFSNDGVNRVEMYTYSTSLKRYRKIIHSLFCIAFSHKCVHHGRVRTGEPVSFAEFVVSTRGLGGALVGNVTSMQSS